MCKYYDSIPEFGIRKCSKKLVISDIFCIFVVEIQIVTNIKKYHNGDYQGQSYRIILYN